MSSQNDVHGTTRDASKDRREKIKDQMAIMRDLLPLPDTARQRLAQLQIMSLSCVYIRKCDYFPRLFPCSTDNKYLTDVPYEFTEALNGFLIVMNRDGKLVYLSDNITQYLGHSKVDMMTQGDEINDIIDSSDHAMINEKLQQPIATEGGCDERSFICNMNVSRKLRRQLGLEDQKMMHIRGRFLNPKYPGHYRNVAVFVGICSPVITPDLKESMVPNSTLVFRSVHSLSMHFIEISQIGEFHLAYGTEEIFQKSWYNFVHPDDAEKAREKHMLLIKSDYELGCMLTVRLLTKTGGIVWCNIVMHVVQNTYLNDDDDPKIICINQIISPDEAPLFRRLSQSHNSQIAQSPRCLTPVEVDHAHPIDYEGRQNPYIYQEGFDMSYSDQQSRTAPSGLYEGSWLTDPSQYGGSYDTYHPGSGECFNSVGASNYTKVSHNSSYDFNRIHNLSDYVSSPSGVAISHSNSTHGGRYCMDDHLKIQRVFQSGHPYCSVPLTPPMSPDTSIIETSLNTTNTGLCRSLNNSTPLPPFPTPNVSPQPTRCDDYLRGKKITRKRVYDLKVINVMDIDDYFTNVSSDSCISQNEDEGPQSKRAFNAKKSRNPPSDTQVTSSSRVMTAIQPPPSHGAQVSPYFYKKKSSASPTFVGKCDD